MGGTCEAVGDPGGRGIHRDSGDAGPSGGSNEGGGRFDIAGTVPQVRGHGSAVLASPAVTEIRPESARHDVEIAIVTMRFDGADPGALLAVLSKYIVLTRMQPGCRNIDLCASVTRPGRYLIIQKWESVEAQRRHFDSGVMVEMATACTGLLTVAPDIDLWDGPSAHDLA
ncbi:MAG: hypothetical protein RLZZ623_1720 [Actinomycetota bacterium]